MTPHIDESLQRSFGRLRENNDFIQFQKWLGETERTVGFDLRSSTNLAIVHQMQGAAQLLEDIKQAFASAQPALA